MVAERQAPYTAAARPLTDRALERLLLAQLLNAEEAKDGALRVAQLLRRDDFLGDDHRALFDVVIELGCAGNPTTPLTVSTVLVDRGLTDLVCGPNDNTLVTISDRRHAFDVLSWWAEEAPSTAGVALTARSLQTLAYNRTMVSTLHGLQDGIVYGRELAAPATLAAHVLQTVTALDPGARTGEPRWLFDYDDGELQSLATWLDDPTALPGFASGLRTLDRKVGGWEPATTTVIAGRPGVGKSILGLRLAQGFAEAGHAVYYASCEMPARSLRRRLWWARSGVSPETLQQRGTAATADERRRLQAAQEWSDRLRILVDDQSGNQWPQLAAHMTQAVARDGVQVCVIDHIDLVQYPKQERLNRHTQISTVMNALQAFGATHGVVMIVLSQVNRAGAGRDDGFPSLEDLRESGTKEESADKVLLLARPAAGKDFFSLPLEQRHLFRVRVAKNRNGTTGDLPLFVDPTLFRLEDRAPEYVR